MSCPGGNAVADALGWGRVQGVQEQEEDLCRGVRRRRLVDGDGDRKEARLDASATSGATIMTTSGFPRAVIGLACGGGEA